MYTNVCYFVLATQPKISLLLSFVIFTAQVVFAGGRDSEALAGTAGLREEEHQRPRQSVREDAAHSEPALLHDTILQRTAGWFFFSF